MTDYKLSFEDEHLRAFKWRVSDGRPYLLARYNGKPQYLHRVVAKAKPGDIVDHINGDKMDNRRENLRICSRAESNRNRSAKRTSSAPYKGITQQPSGKWLAQIMVDGQHHRLGLWDSAEAAAEAYAKASKRLHGEFGCTSVSR